MTRSERPERGVRSLDHSGAGPSATSWTTERTPVRAPEAAPAKSHSLRYFGAPGMRAWTALPQRDQALLRWLVPGSVVTAELAALLVYGGLRTARRRLHRLVEDGLVRGYWAANSQRPRGRYAYALVGPARDELERRREAPGGKSRSIVMPTIHQLATHDVLAAFLRAADPSAGRGLVAWLPERAAADLFDGYLRPDAVGVVRTAAGQVLLFIERDLGTETARAVADKVARYRRVLRHRSADQLNVGIVVSSPRRSVSIRRALGRPELGRPTVWVGLADEILRDPLGAMWLGLDGGRRVTVDLPSTEMDDRHVLGALCLLDPDAVEAFDQPPARLARAIGLAPDRS